MIKSPIPLLIDRLKLVGMPSLGEAQEDIHQGFQVVGTIHQGAGCLPRAESRYEFPLSPEACAENNKHYTLAKLRIRYVDPEWATTPASSSQSSSGPYVAPDWWPVGSATIVGARTSEDQGTTQQWSLRMYHIITTSKHLQTWPCHILIDRAPGWSGHRTSTGHAGNSLCGIQVPCCSATTP